MYFLFWLMFLFTQVAIAGMGASLEIVNPQPSQRIVEVGGKPLAIEVENVSRNFAIAHDLRLEYPESWAGVEQDSSDCLLLFPGRRCTIRLSASLAYEPGEIRLVGKNLEHDLLTFIAFRYAGGLVYLARAGRIEVISEQDQRERTPWAIDHWHMIGVVDGEDGYSNTWHLATLLGEGAYAARICYESREGGYSDWYLPAICQWGLDEGKVRDIECSPSRAMIYDQLHRRGFGNLERAMYWSSTEYAVNFPGEMAWSFGPLTGAQLGASKNNPFRVRCVRNAA